MRLSGLHDWPCPPFGGLFYAWAFSPDRGTRPGGGAMRLSGLHDVHMG